jgi:Tfp pilus assembly protein PilO
MAKKDVLNQLARKPPAVQAGLLGAVLLVLGGLYWQLFYLELAESRQRATNKNRTLLTRNRELKEREKQWLELVQKKEELDAMLRKNQVSLPASSELPSFFVHLQKQAAAAGVNVKSWSRKNEQPVEAYMKVPVAMEVTGTFYQINHYFKLLYETDRIITVEDLKIGDAVHRGEEVILTASFRASTFRQAGNVVEEALVVSDPAAGSMADATRKREQAVAGSLPAGERSDDKEKAPAAPEGGGQRLVNPGAEGAR